MDYIAQPKDYWIAQGAITITLNALGNPNRTQGSVASGAAILCYIEGVDGLGYDNGHRFKTWPLSLSPTYFNSNTQKYVYAAIPRTATVGTQAVVVFPSEKLDIYGKNAEEMQVGSSDYYYIWLQGIISSSGDYGATNRTWTEEIDFGKKGTDEDLYDDTDGEWYQYSKVSEIVTFLKNITMKAGATFYNLYLGYKELTGVATATTGEEYVDSETLVATPSYIHANYLRKNVEDTAEEQIGFLKGLWIGIKGLYEITAEGVAKFKSLFVEDITAQRMQVEDMQSSNYTGDGIADTGWRLTKDYNGHSKLTVDELYVRMKAVFEALEVKKELVSGGNQVQSCAASVISKVDYLNANKEAIGYDEYKVPFTLRSAIMMLFKGQNPFGSYSRTRKVRLKLTAFDRQNVRYVRCYFLAKEGDRKIQNWWRVADPNDNSTGNDMARCQTFNLASDSISERDTYFGTNTQKQGNIFWWRKLAGVSTTPVEIDGKQYHYFDVYCNPLAEAAIPYSYSGAMEGSDIPAPGDEVSQWGNDNDIDRMNLIVQEVNGQDAAIKMYEGINQFSMETGLYGNPLKIRFAPKTGCKVHTTKWEVVTETFIAPIPVECGNWSDITPVQGQRTARYYEIYQHNGGSWLCVTSNGGTFKVIEAFSTYAVGDTITQTVYDALTVNQQMCCARVSFGTTTDEPSTTSAAWRQYAAKGEKGDGQPDYIQTQEAWSSLESVANVTTEPTPNGGWSDTTPANANNYAYLWRRSRKMVLQSDGTYAAATGSDGQWKYARLSGTNGTSISVKGTVATVADLSNITNPQDGDAYVVSANGHLYMWSSEASDWIDLGQFKGDPGVTYYTHVAWASAVTLGTTPSGHTTTGQTTTPNATSVTGFNMSPFAGAAWMGILVNTVASDSNDGLAYTWKKVEGPQGEDAVSIVISPASLIVNQDLNYTTNLSNLTEKFVVRVYKGSAEHGQELTVNGLSFVAETVPNSSPTAYKCLFLNGGGQRSGNSSIAGNELTLKQINTYTQDGKTLYYDSMFVDVTATYNTNKTIKARVRIYANLLGTWAETVEADVKHEVATSKFYFEDENGNVVAHETIGDFIKSSTENTSVLTKKVNEGKNLLTLTSGWEGYGGAAVKYDKKNFGVWDENSDLYSPFIRLAEGQSVCFSAYMSSYAAQSGNWYIGYGSTPPEHLSDLYDNASIPIALTQKPGDSITVDGTAYDRYYYVLNAGTVFVDQYITFNFADTYKLFCPQLEIGNVPTAFAAGSIETSSQIKQTADGISLTVHGEIAGGNINILYGVDGYTSSNKLEHKMMAGDGVMEYDGTGGKPHIFTSVQLIEGCTYTIQCVTDGNIASAHASSGNPSDRKCTIWLRMDGSLNGGYQGECFTSLYNGYQNLGSGRHKWTFVCQKTGEYWFRTNSYSDGTTEVAINFWNIKLEGGSSATAFTGNTSQMGSEIKLTANEIKLFVTDGLENTGINILNGTIDLIANKIAFKYYDNNNVLQNANVSISTADGTLHATNVDLSGKIVATSGTIGGFIINSTQIKSSDNSNNISLNSDGTAKLGVLSITASGTSITGDLTVSSTSGMYFKLRPSTTSDASISAYNSSGKEMVTLGINSFGRPSLFLGVPDGGQDYIKTTRIDPEQISLWGVFGTQGYLSTLDNGLEYLGSISDYYAQTGGDTWKRLQVGIRNSAVMLKASDENGDSAWPEASRVAGQDGHTAPNGTSTNTPLGEVRAISLEDLRVMLATSSQYYGMMKNCGVLLVRMT